MTGTDLIVLAPWIVFAAGLAVICLVLLRSHRALQAAPPSIARAVTPARPGRPGGAGAGRLP